MKPGKVCGALFALALLWPATADAQNVKLGKEVFLEKAQPSCGLCHTLKDANTTGEIGPDLDELQPDRLKVRNAVKNGVGNMPPFGDTLTNFEIDSVARYVSDAVRGKAK